MGERKVLNKYYPPDFNPAKIPRRRQPKNNQTKITMMLPMSIRCGTCGNYIYKGTKFNSRREDSGEDYLGIRIIRLYFKCPNCSSELRIKTDPQNSDYVVESGALRNSEPWRADEEAIERKKRRTTEAEEIGDTMKSLENRASAAKRDVEIDAKLEELKSMKTRHAGVGSDAVLERLNRLRKEEERKQKEEDEKLVKSVFGKPKMVVRRIDDDDLEGGDDGFYWRI